LGFEPFSPLKNNCGLRSGIGCSGSTRLYMVEARAQGRGQDRHEPGFYVRDRLAKKNLVIEIEPELDQIGRSRARVLSSSSARVKIEY
jgi:hypothetical protein